MRWAGRPGEWLQTLVRQPPGEARWQWAKAGARVLLQAGKKEQWLLTDDGRQVLAGELGSRGIANPEAEDLVYWTAGLGAYYEGRVATPWPLLGAVAAAVRAAPEGLGKDSRAKKLITVS